MATDRLTVRVGAKLRARLARIVEDTGKTESEVVREALERYSAEHGKKPSCYDLAKKLGIIGIVRDAPSDLSTNPDYFEGFGRE